MHKFNSHLLGGVAVAGQLIAAAAEVEPTQA
jgi:hypothetical protein